MNTLITFLSADISVGFAFSITMVAILVMAAITQVIKSDYEDTIRNMEKDMHESNERNDIYQSVYKSFKPLTDEDEAELRKMEL